MKRTTEITLQANKWYESRSDEDLVELIRLATPIIEHFTAHTCQCSSWDKDELYSSLLYDFYKLVVNRWTFDPKLPFHALMLRNFKNKCRNFVSNQKQVSRIPLTSYKLLDGSESDHTIIDPLNQIIAKEQIDKLLDYLKHPPIGRGLTIHNTEQLIRIVEMLYNGNSVTQIRRSLNLPGPLFNSRILTLRSILSRLENPLLSDI